MLRKGSVVIMSASGVRGKPRPAIVFQSPDFEYQETVIVVPLTAHEVKESVVTPLFFPTATNGLTAKSIAMVGRIGAIRKSEIGRVAGALSEDELERLSAAVSLVLGITPNESNP